MKILIINGPNLNLLGSREPEIYGRETYFELCKKIENHASKSGAAVNFFQSNHEGEIIDKIQSAYKNVLFPEGDFFDAIIINPAAFTHYSFAIYDALKACPLKKIEVHLSNIHSRDEFRRNSVTAPACLGQISGLGAFGYIAAIDFLLNG